MKNISIAIDGPAGAGKSTIAKIVSKTLNIIYLDTGAMYRTVALKALRNDVNTTDFKAMEHIIENIDVKIAYENSQQHIYLDNEDVTNMIRTSEVSIGASNVAAIPAVRLKMVDLQRQIANENSVVMDGRDIGTYVLPNADLKVFLTASVEERARRRYNEQVDKGTESITFEEVKSDIEYRDKNDSSRKFAPLKKAEDAIAVDTTNMSILQVVDFILGELKKKGNII